MSLGEEYEGRDALGLAELVRKSEVHPTELLEEAIARAERVNPRINAIVQPMYELARDRAKRELPDGPFRGVPFLLKDLAAAYAGVPMMCGSRLFRGFVPAKHSTLVERFEKAGLVTFAKTVTSELGILPVCEAEVYGPSHNPWRHGLTPGGSSGGAAAAVAAGVVPMAHASDGGGSIRIPASCCGVFGMKPSRMRTPPGPELAELFFGFAVENVVSRSVRDSAAILDEIAGPEPTSMFFAPSGGSFRAALDRAPEKLKIAFTSEPLLPAKSNVDATRAVEDAAALCESLGHHVERARPKIDARLFARAFVAHFAAGVASELSMLGPELLHRPTRASDVEQTTWLLALIGRSFDAATFVTQRRILLDQSLRVMRFFETYDVLLTPTLGQPPVAVGSLAPSGIEASLHAVVARAARPEIMRIPGLLDGMIDQAFAFTPYTPVFNVTGQPSANVPLFWNDDDIPIGAMFTGRMGEDARLLRLAAQLEEARPWFGRRPPIRS
jgi:amidase